LTSDECQAAARDPTVTWPGDEEVRMPSDRVKHAALWYAYIYDTLRQALDFWRAFSNCIPSFSAMYTNSQFGMANSKDRDRLAFACKMEAERRIEPSKVVLKAGNTILPSYIYDSGVLFG